MEAGRVYHRQGRILSLQERPPEIEALVRGSSQVPYHVRITVTPCEKVGVRIKGDCSCPVGAYCKHIAAVLIESRARHPDIGVSKQAELFSAKPASQALSKDSLLRTFPTGLLRSNARRLRIPRIIPRMRKIVFSMFFRSPYIATRHPNCRSRRCPRAS